MKKVPETQKNLQFQCNYVGIVLFCVKTNLEFFSSISGLESIINT